MEALESPLVIRTVEQPRLEDVWSSYSAIGTDMPHAVGPEVFRDHLRTLSGIHRTHHPASTKLRGFIHYELGLAQHIEQPVEAGRQFKVAQLYFDLSRQYSAANELRQASLTVMTRLMIDRSTQYERLYKQTQYETVRSLGRLIVANADLSQFSSYGQAGNVYGALIETAFAAAFLTHTNPDMTFIGAPTTPRQDSPQPGRPGKGGAEAAQIGNPACDINLYLYHGADYAPFTSARVQIKSKDNDQARSYDHDIIVLYADRDLFVSNRYELQQYGNELAEYDGAPTRAMEIASSNIDLALSLRNRHFRQPGISTAS